MKSIKAITISLPVEMVHEIQKIADEEDSTVSELVCESFRQYKAQRTLHILAKKGRAVSKIKGLKSKDCVRPCC